MMVVSILSALLGGVRHHRLALMLLGTLAVSHLATPWAWLAFGLYALFELGHVCARFYHNKVLLGVRKQMVDAREAAMDAGIAAMLTGEEGESGKTADIG